MKVKDISKGFAPIVAEAIAEGYAPCMDELRGSYSGVEGSQLVLERGRERLILWVGRGVLTRPRRTNLPLLRANVAHITLGRGESLEYNYPWPHNWSDHLVSSTPYYEAARGWYVGTVEEAEAIEDKREARREARYVKTYREWEVTDELLAIVRRIKGFKSVRRENVRVMRTKDGWRVENRRSGNYVTSHKHRGSYRVA